MQKSILSKAKPFIEETIVQLYCTTFPRCLTIADLGCSSGPNSLFTISELLKAINAVCQKLGRSPPEFQVFLNDLPQNDFNTLFKSTPNFYEKFRSENGQEFGPIFVAGVPGSFYNRLFPTKILNFVHSCYGLHWLSQVPQGIDNNKGNVYLARTSPSNVYKAYAEQFNRDFSVFLSSRSKEMMIGGCMVITIAGRRSSGDPPSKDCFYFWEVFSKTLRNMVSEGIIDEAKLDSFNLPFYTPSIEEVQTIIKSEGSFDLDWIKTFDIDWDTSEDYVNREFVHDKIRSGEFVAKAIRAVVETIFVSHFGDSAIEDFFCRYAKDVEDSSVISTLTDGHGAVNPRGVNYYNNLINELVSYESSRKALDASVGFSIGGDDEVLKLDSQIKDFNVISPRPWQRCSLGITMTMTTARRYGMQNATGGWHFWSCRRSACLLAANENCNSVEQQDI
ncbi:Salicylate carboxymethyltransferase [Thalictrum thalictroides]|uniref:Salicylate carboxymethyltransferase n=1 Tax=Thalictrum thalictroides TaxID=46969 RepID=A0A7J6UT68_THATH|nr:Salicylate carboxymethyltransferase [Thalictrum thalictroides]